MSPRSTLVILFNFVGAVWSFGQNQIAIDLITDYYGAEITWVLHSLGGGDTLASGGPYVNTPGVNTAQPTVFVDLPDGAYQLSMFDSYGDGYESGYGFGSMTVTDVATGEAIFFDNTWSSAVLLGEVNVPYMRVSGSLFLDDDGDCVQDVGEVGVPYHVVEIQPGGLFALSGSDGYYAIQLPAGSYSAGAGDPDLVPVCPVAQPVPFEISTATPLASVPLGVLSTEQLDIHADVASGPARPGFQYQQLLSIVNLTGQGTGPITASYDLDPAVSFLSADPAPSSVAGGTYIWELPAFDPFASITIAFVSEVPPDPLLVGTELIGLFQVQQPVPESSVTNNTAEVSTTVTASFDPNDKVAATTSGVPGTYLIDQDDWLHYTIRFQNTGTDTAFTVVVTDTISVVLDMSTYQQGAVSHPFTVSMKPDRVVEWKFEDILLPDSTTNEPASHGMLSFRIRPVQPLATGTAIENTANIFFDFNPPVITEPSVLVAEFSTGVRGSTGSPRRLEVVPNPAVDHIRLVLPQGTAHDAVWTILTTDGRILASGSVNASEEIIDISSLAAGTYFLRSIHGDRTFTSPFMKHSSR